MNAENDRGESIQIHNPRKLGVESLPAQRVPVGAPGDYKPCVGLLPGGELLLVAFQSQPLEGTRRIGGQEVPRLHEDILLFRSQNGGITWGGPEKPDLPGREPYFTVLSDGTVLVTVHHLIQDIRNEAGYIQTYVHRSTDGGHTWGTIRFPGEDLPGWQPGMSFTCSTRTILERRDGSLRLGISAQRGLNFLFRSNDKGATWERTTRCTFDVYPDDRPSQYPVWGEDVLWEAKNGDLLSLHRGDSRELPPLPGVDRPNGHWDHHDRLVLFRSTDGGSHWTYSELGSFYGEMYPALLRLQDGRMLLTFTVRDLRPPLGVRAVLGEETGDGFRFDFEHDRLMLDTKTPLDKESGGGFGRTVQLDDGTLITSYSYRGVDDQTHCEVVRWRLP